MVSDKTKTLFECYRFHNLFKSNIKTKKWNKKKSKLVLINYNLVWWDLPRDQPVLNSKLIPNSWTIHSIFFFIQRQRKNIYNHQLNEINTFFWFKIKVENGNIKSPWLNTKTRESIFWQYNYVYEIPVTIMVGSNKDPENETKHKTLDLTPKHFTNLYELTVIYDWNE